MNIQGSIERKKKRIREAYIKEAEEKGLEGKDLERLKDITEGLDKGTKVRESKRYTFQERLRVYGLLGIPMYEEYKIRQDIQLIEYLESKRVVKITEQGDYLGVAQRKAGRLNRHVKYKKGELAVDEESYKMMEMYKDGMTLEEIGQKYNMSKANVGYRLEVIDPEYTYKYGDTSYTMLRRKNFVVELEEAIQLGDVDDKIKRDKKLPNVEMIKVVREALIDVRKR